MKARTPAPSLVCAVLFMAVLAMGCKSRPLGPYVSPRVTGQVLAAANGEPLPDVQVSRGLTHKRGSGSSPKGSELLMQKAPVRTDVDGRFVLSSERVLSIVRGSGWDTVSLAFDRPGFHHFQTNVPVNLATTKATGEPLLDIGVIRLQAVSR